MTVAFGIAIYFIVWWITLFVVLPFGLRTQEEQGDVVPGTPASAPARIQLMRIFAINTAVAAIVFAVVWYVIATNWVTLDALPPLR
jgi:predicted secreted protein